MKDEKRSHLLRDIRQAARKAGKELELVRQGRHEVWRVGATTFPIPRHKVIGAKLSFEIRASLEGELGARWWRP